MKLRNLILFVALALPAGAAAGTTIFVAPTGKPGAAGTPAAPLASLAEAAERARAGDVVRLAGGTYRHAQTIHLKNSGTVEAPIRVECADADSWPVFDFSEQQFGRDSSGIAVEGDYWHLVGLEVVRSGRFGISITGHHDIIERCRTHDNQGTGINAGAPASYALIVDCDSYRNVDRPTRGQNADGFGAKFEVGPGIVFRGCRAWENADDGFDLWRAPHSVRIENCLAYRNGIDLWGIEGFTGNGNGFKLGGDFVPAAHVIVGCVVADQPKNGFDQNNNAAPILFERCTALRCGCGFSVILAAKSGAPSILRGNIACDAPAILVRGTVEENNLWTGADHEPVAPKFVESLALTRTGKVPYDPAKSSGPPPRTPPSRSAGNDPH